MIKIRKTLTILVFSVIASIIAFAGIANAAELKSLYVTINEDGVASANSVIANTATVRLVDGYLYLPSCANLKALKLCYTGEGALTVKANSNSGKSTKFKSGEFVNISSLFGGNKPSDYKYPVKLTDENGQTLDVTIMKSYNLPVIFMTTLSGGIDYVNSVKGNEEGGTVCMLDADGKILYNSEMKKIKGRGNASWGGGGTGKKPYNFTLADKAELIPGAGAGKKWCLLNSSADKQDETYFANQMVMEAAFRMSKAYSGLATEMVEFYCNGDYRGLYEITEKIDASTSLVDIFDQEDIVADGPFGESRIVTDSSDSAIANGIRSYSYWSSAAYKEPDPDITGGYIIEGDGYYSKEKCWFVTKQGIGCTVKNPEYATREQVCYIAEYVQDYENALFSATGYNDKGKHYSEYADMDSLATRFIIENFFYCREQLGNSTYMCKAQGNDSKLFFGPMWDYENVMSSYAWIRNGSTTQYNPYNTFCVGTKYGNILLTKVDFMKKVYDINSSDFMPMIDWFLGTPTAENNGISLNEMAAKYEASVKMDILRWKKQDIWNDELDKTRNWLNNRINYWAGRNGITSLFDSMYLRGATATESGGKISLDIRGGASSYSWYKMNDDKKGSSLIEGATQATYTPPAGGVYYAVVEGYIPTNTQSLTETKLTTNPVNIVK